MVTRLMVVLVKDQTVPAEQISETAKKAEPDAEEEAKKVGDSAEMSVFVD